MSQVAPRAIALQEANKLGLTDADSVLAAARAFVDFILAGDVPSPAPAQPAAPKSAAPKPVKVAKPVAAPEADLGPANGAPTVKSVVDGLLAAGKRDEAVALLKKFGATSVSGVKAAVADDFIAEGTAILNGEDLTS
jgi:hypothetical protein